MRRGSRARHALLWELRREGRVAAGAGGTAGPGWRLAGCGRLLHETGLGPGPGGLQGSISALSLTLAPRRRADGSFWGAEAGFRGARSNGRSRGAALDQATGVPQSRQNRAPGASGLPHAEHVPGDAAGGADAASGGAGCAGGGAEPSGIALALYLGVATMAVANALLTRGIHGLRPGPVATLMLTDPVVATILGVVVLGEALTPVAAVGVLMVLGGLVLQGLVIAREEPDLEEPAPVL